MTNFEKIREYKGKIAGKWMVPDTFRRWTVGANKILKLHYRLLNSGLLWPDLVKDLKDITAAWEDIGLARYREKINNQYFNEFDEIKTFDVTRHLAFQKNIQSLLGDDKVETFVEEKREREEHTRCHLCNVKLVFPAYVVHRLGTEEIHRSESIGIMCLHATHGKLQKLLQKNELQRLLAEIRHMEHRDAGVVTVAV